MHEVGGLPPSVNGSSRRRSMWAVSVVGQSVRRLRAGTAGREVLPDGTHIVFTPNGEPRVTFLKSGDEPPRDQPHKPIAVGGDEWIDNVHWSADGQRLAYTRVQVPSWSHTARNTLDKFYASIESCDLNGANRTVVVTY